MVTKNSSNLYGVIDVGSNSVRLMLWRNEKTLYKKVKVTKLAEGLGNGSQLQDCAIDRTARAVSFFVEEAREANADEIFVFATAAVRQAVNGSELVMKVKELTGLTVDVISGMLEAEIGLLGAVSFQNGGIIDVGGASTEISVLTDGKTAFCKTVSIGCVKITDICGQDCLKAQSVSETFAKEFNNAPLTTFYGIGGTATSIAAILQSLDPYDSEKVHGYVINQKDLICLKDRLYSMTVDERKKLKGLQPERAEVIAGGVSILLSVMNVLKIDKITVSEKDNLEGYLYKKRRIYE